ncbi:MAG: sigma-54-dependent Fis family transcriptional regulator [Gammaproteobacteria bacterium]|nr:sigma-54-dependent Fis family transcriptional regulator [Gammaproteobacteria bacterium]
MSQAAEILLVDDEAIALANLQHVLEGEGHTVTAVDSGEAAIEAIGQGSFDLVLTDLRMPGVDGMEVLRASRARNPQCPVILVSGQATVDSAVEAMREGAFHYLTKPFRLDEVRHMVAEALELHGLRKENTRLRQLLDEGDDTPRFLTQDPSTQRLLETARLVARSDSNIVISGESGTGKELLARFIHQHSGRVQAPFVAVNCGAFSEELLTNELFGHAKGAYTGAGEARPGLIESADGGTLFLDEFTEMSPSMQVKLLRVIQEGELRRLGENQDRRVNVRYLAASNRDLQQAVANGSLRQDLYFRLNVVHLELKPLRERRDDIPLLAHYFLKRHAAAMGREHLEISARAVAALVRHDFPGNVRELSNLIERGVALCDGKRLDLAQLPNDLQRYQGGVTLETEPTQLPTLEQQERDYIDWVLQKTGGNRTRAAAILGIDRVSLWRKLKKYELS